MVNGPTVSTQGTPEQLLREFEAMRERELRERIPFGEQAQIFQTRTRRRRKPEPMVSLPEPTKIIEMPEPKIPEPIIIDVGQETIRTEALLESIQRRMQFEEAERRTAVAKKVREGDIGAALGLGATAATEIGIIAGGIRGFGPLRIPKISPRRTRFGTIEELKIEALGPETLRIEPRGGAGEFIDIRPEVKSFQIKAGEVGQKVFSEEQIAAVERAFKKGAVGGTAKEAVAKARQEATKAKQESAKLSQSITEVVSGETKLIQRLKPVSEQAFNIEKLKGIDTLVKLQEVSTVTRFEGLGEFFGKLRPRKQRLLEELEFETLRLPPGKAPQQLSLLQLTSTQEQTQVQKQLQDQLISQTKAQEQIQSQLIFQTQLQDQRQRQAQSISQAQVQTQSQDQTQAIAQAQSQAQSQLQKQSQALEQALALELGKPTRGARQPLRPLRPRLTFPLILPLGAKPKKILGKPKKQPGYNAFVKERGKVRKLTRKPRTMRTALSIGGNFVDTTPAASFTIRAARKPAQGAEIDTFRFISDKFRKRRTKNALELVEKRKFRLDSIGELVGLKKAKKGKEIDLRGIL
jgi:hypothetical protein